MKIVESGINRRLMSREVELLVLGVEAQEVTREVAAQSTNWTQGARRVGTAMRRILILYRSLALVSPVAGCRKYTAA
jgi:hypothetical protein